MSSVEYDGTRTPQGKGPTAGDLVPESRRVRKKKKKKDGWICNQIVNFFGTPRKNK